MGLNSPFDFEGKTYYFTYSEIDKEDASVNLPFVIIDAKRDGNGNSRLFEGNYTKRKGHWYIVISIYDENIENCLLDKHPMKPKLINYLRNLKEEYLSTHNYEELLLTKKS